jgi:hypothetical protein
LILFITIFLSGCFSLRRTGKIFYKNGEGRVYYDTIIKLNITNRDFNIQKAEIELIKDDERQAFLANLKYRKGGNYLLSIRSKSGIEAARFYLTKDTILINDKIRRKIYYGSSSYLNEKYGITTSALPVLFGDYLSNTKTDSSSLVCTNGLVYRNERMLNKKICYTIDCQNKKVQNAKITDEDEDEVIIFSYDRFQSENNSLFPGKIEIEDNLKNFIVRITIEKIDFIRIESINFIPGNNYEKVLLK